MRKETDSRYRLKQLILFIAQGMQGAEFFGVTKLNKVLFRSEFAAFRELGHKLTTYHYQKNENGPTLRAFLPILREMEQESLVHWDIRHHPGKSDERRLVPLVEPDLEAFSPAEWEITRTEVVRAFPLSGRQVSEEEHTTAIWFATRMGENIKPELCFVEDPGAAVPLSHDEDQQARDTIERFLARTAGGSRSEFLRKAECGCSIFTTSSRFIC